MCPRNNQLNSKNIPTPRTENKLELLYDGYYYNVSSFVSKHPGGELILRMYLNNGEDATHAIQQFHFRSKLKVQGILRSLPRRKAKEEELIAHLGSEKLERHRLLSQDFNELFQELINDGLFEPSLTHVLLRCMELALLSIIGLWLVNKGWTLLGLLSLSWSCGRSGWFIHEGGHHSLTGRPQIDRWIQSYVYGTFLGLSASCWRNHHSKHHAMPQHWKNDIDLHTLPIMAFHSCVIHCEKGKQQFNFLLKYQKWTIYIIQSSIIGFWWKYVEDPIYAWRNKEYCDIFHMTLNFGYLYYLGFPSYIFICVVVMSYLVLNSTLNHTHLEVTTEPTHWVEYGLTHTANVRSSWWVDYFMGNLNYQIEHHLFPTMPQFRNKLVRDKVKALAKKHNLKYHLYDYWTILKMTLENLSNVSDEIEKLSDKVN